MLQFKSVSKKEGLEHYIYPTDILLEKHIFNVLLGPTLSGKTTFMRLMAGLETPTTGRVFFNGIDYTDLPVQKRNVAMIYQQFINYPGYSVFNNIASPLYLKKQSRSEIKERVHKIADLLKLTPYLQRKVNELSGGQQQRTALARALVKEADLILLDEPFANLDFKLREELRDELPRLLSSTNSVIVYATTEPTEALLIGGKTTLLNEGKVIQVGDAIDTYQNPVSLKSAETFSDPPINVVEVQKQQERIFLANQSWDIHIYKDSAIKNFSDVSLQLAIRPHHLFLKSPASSSEVIKLDGTVDICEITGSESMIYISAHGHKWVLHTHEVCTYQPGDEISFWFNPENCFYFNVDGERIV